MHSGKKSRNSVLHDSSSSGHLSTNNDNYLARNHIFEYLSDCVEQLLDLKSRSITKADVLEYFTHYFKNVKNGRHVLYREYKFIMLTPYNRSCFINNFYQAFSYLNAKNELLDMKEYYSLVTIVCHDFPLIVIKNISKIISGSGNLVNDNSSFKEFLFALSFQVYYDEFIKETYKIFESIISIENRLRAVETNEKNLKLVPINEAINSKKFFENIENTQAKVNYSFPPLSIIKEVLMKESSVYYYDFLNRLAKNESIYGLIGKPINKEAIHENEKISIESNKNEIHLLKSSKTLPYSSIKKQNKNEKNYSQKKRSSFTSQQLQKEPDDESDNSTSTSNDTSDTDTFT